MDGWMNGWMWSHDCSWVYWYTYTDAAGWLTGWLLLLKYERVTRGAKKRTIIFSVPGKAATAAAFNSATKRWNGRHLSTKPQTAMYHYHHNDQGRRWLPACLPACLSMSGSTSWWQLWAGNTGGGWNITNTCHVVRSYHTLTLNPLHCTTLHFSTRHTKNTITFIGSKQRQTASVETVLEKWEDVKL